MSGSVLTMSAQTVARSFTVDLELKLPERPYFPMEILVLPFRNGGILFEGARGTQVLQGRSARDLVAAILPYLDGRNDLADLATKLPSIRPDSIRMVIALLFSRGLLQDGNPDDITAQNSELASFLGRYTDVTRVNRNRDEALERLANSVVGLAGSGPFVDTIAEAMSNSGIGRISVVADPGELTSDITLLVADPGNEVWFDRADDLGIDTLHVSVSRECVEIGPLFVSGKSACYSCFRARKPAPAGRSESYETFWAGVAALNVFHLLSRVGTPALYNQCHIYKRTSLGAAYEREYIARLPGCRRCGLGGLPALPTKELEDIWIFHNATISPPLEFVNPRDHQHHYDAANLRITETPAEPYYGATIINLPEAVDLPQPPSWLHRCNGSRRPVDLDLLAAAFRFAVGYQQVAGMARRHIAPSAGSLSSPEGFLISREVSGLEPGIYRYNAATHALEYLGGAPDDVLASVIGISVGELPEALIVGVACLEKIRSKYGNASFRLYNLDSGFACCYFREVLTSFDLVVSEFENARDIALARLLHVPLSGNRNALTYVLGVTATPESLRRRARVGPEHVVDALIDRASILQVPTQLVPPTIDGRPMSDHLGWLAGDLGTLLKHRRSIRDFARRSIPRAQIETIIGCAHEAQISRIAAGGLPIHATLWLSVREPSGDLSTGIYRWDPSNRILQQVRQVVPEDEIIRTTLQSSLSQAPAILFVTMDFGDAVSRFGARGYREMLSHAGTIAAKALLVGASLGVSGCPWGGVVEVGWAGF